MHTPKKTKRAAHSIDLDKVTRPSVLTFPVSDEVAANIGLIVTEYIRLEQRMIDVFRVVLGIESGEAAALAYNAIRAPAARWEIARAVLEKDHGHVKTPPSYDDLIDRFHEATQFRNECVHGLWQMDQNNQPWKTNTNKPEDTLFPRKFGKSDFGDMLLKMRELYDDIIAVVEQDRRLLERRWLKRGTRSRGNRP